MSINVRLDLEKVRKYVNLLIPGVHVRHNHKGGFAGYIKENGELAVIVRQLLEESAVEVFIPIVLKPPTTGYVSIKWKSRVINIPTPSDNKVMFYFIGAEYVPGYNDGFSIYMIKDSTGAISRKASVVVDGTETSQDISFDETVEHEFEIRWYSDHVEFYIDGSQVANISASPSRALMPFIELMNYSTACLPAPGAEAIGIKDLVAVINDLAKYL